MYTVEKVEVVINNFQVHNLLKDAAGRGIQHYTILPVLAGAGVHGVVEAEGLLDLGYSFLIFLLDASRFEALKEVVTPYLKAQGGIMTHHQVQVDYPPNLT